MQYTKLGNSDLNVSRICMGCMGFGNAATGQHSWTLDEAASREIIKRGLELGVNFFDTAIGYQNGTSEEYLGRALKDFARREDVVVATKFPGRSPQEMEAGVTGQQHVANLLDQSLRHLGTDYVDLYIYHMWDYATPLYEILEGLSNAVKAGKARYVGISNCFAYQLAKANALAEKEGFPKFVSIQGHYILVFREEEREMVTFCYLAAQGGCEPQLTAHAKGNMNLGNDREFLTKVVSQCLPYIGYPRSLNAIACINKAAEQ